MHLNYVEMGHTSLSEAARGPRKRTKVPGLCRVADPTDGCRGTESGGAPARFHRFGGVFCNQFLGLATVRN